MIGRAACVAIFSSNGHVLVIRHPNGLFGLPGGKCKKHESPMRCARREVFEETGLRLRGQLERVLIAKAGLHECYGYLYSEAISAYTQTLPEPGCTHEWRHPSEMDASDARFWIFNRELFGILRGTGHTKTLPGANEPDPIDASSKFYVRLNLADVDKDIARQEAFFESL